jgi:hypothetical protein
MNIKITLFITLFLYAVIISQRMFYILGMSKVLNGMQAIACIDTRKLPGQHLRASPRIVYYVSLIASVALIAFCLVNSSGLLFICTVIAPVCLLVDLVLTGKGNIPINKIFNSWMATDYPADRQQYRSRWFSFYHMRQHANMIGFFKPACRSCIRHIVTKPINKQINQT